MAKNIDLAALFNVQGLIQPKTLTNETVDDLNRKTGNELSEDVRELLDNIRTQVDAQDINGVIETLDAIQRRLDVMKWIANEIKKRAGL